MPSAGDLRRKRLKEEWAADRERNKRIATICRVKVGTACLSSYVDEKLLKRLQRRSDEVYENAKKSAGRKSSLNADDHA